MRMVDIYLTADGLLGWRHMLVVSETDTKVLLLQPNGLRTVTMPRSEFVKARPRTIAKDNARLREQITEGIRHGLSQAASHPKKREAACWDERIAMGRYALANLHHRHARFDVEAALAD